MVIKKSIITWSIYLVLSTGILLVDYLIRLKQGDVQRSSSWVHLSPDGLPMELHVALLFVFGVGAVTFLFKHLRSIQNLYLRYFLLIIQCVFGVLTTSIIWFYYITETGVDNLSYSLLGCLGNQVQSA